MRRESPIELCEAYVEELLGMSFLQYSKTQPSSDGRLDKDVILFTMHDLVHDLARAILAHQVNDKGNAGGNKCRYALLTDCTKPLQLSVTSPANIRALHFRDCRGLELCGDTFSQAMYLHVLDLSECLIQKLPDSIGQLRHSRFLHAPRIQDRMIPDCITELSELNYLNLRGSRHISAMPESIGDMKGLMHLDLSGCGQIHKLPKSFAELKQLVHLDLSKCCVPISDDFCGLTKLQHLNLSFKFESFGINRRGLGVIGNLNKLRYLNLSGCMNDTHMPRDQIGSLLDSISTLSNLEHLDLSFNSCLSSIPESFGNLRKLHTLDLCGSGYIRKLPNCMVNMVSPKVLNVSHRLNESVLSLSNVALLPNFAVHAPFDKCSSNIFLLQPTNPSELRISRLENVKSAEEAQSIKLIEKQKIERLTFQWTVAADRLLDDKEVLEKLVPPSSVQNLCIEGYISASVPDWLMGIRLYLPNLSSIKLRDFPNCKNLPPLDELPNLKELSLSHMESLEEWRTTHSTGEEGENKLLFPKFKRLNIDHCAKLRINPCLPRVKSLRIAHSDNVLSSRGERSSLSRREQAELSVLGSRLPLHQWRLLHQLPALRSLTFGLCSDLTASPEIIQHLSSLESLTLECKDQEELPRWVVELTSLQELSLSSCSSMTLLPKWLVNLTSLQSLQLYGCNRITSLPLLGELTSLKNFEITDSYEIRSLPDSIRQLTKLECLSVISCPKLQEWCESEENKMKLAHIREVIFEVRVICSSTWGPGTA